jgi:hypothetical protein
MTLDFPVTQRVMLVGVQAPGSATHASQVKGKGPDDIIPGPLGWVLSEELNTPPYKHLLLRKHRGGQDPHNRGVAPVKKEKAQQYRCLKKVMSYPFRVMIHYHAAGSVFK